MSSPGGKPMASVLPEILPADWPTLPGGRHSHTFWPRRAEAWGFQQERTTFHLSYPAEAKARQETLLGDCNVPFANEIAGPGWLHRERRATSSKEKAKRVQSKRTLASR